MSENETRPAAAELQPAPESPRRAPTRVLVESAMLVAVAVALSYLKISFLPYGGSITLCALPIVLVSYRRGIKWGLLAGLALSLVQMLNFRSAGFSALSVAVVVLFDYLLPFTALGLGGIFRGNFNAPGAVLALGSVCALALRFLCHFISGYAVWGEYAEWFFSEMGEAGAGILANISGGALAALYSLLYNASYLVPEMIITALAALLLGKYALYGIEDAA